MRIKLLSYARAKHDTAGSLALAQAAVSSRRPHNEKLSCWYSFETAELRRGRVAFKNLSPIGSDLRPLKHKPVILFRGMLRPDAEKVLRSIIGHVKASSHGVGQPNFQLSYQMPSVVYAKATKNGSLWHLSYSLELSYKKAPCGKEWLDHISITVNKTSVRNPFLGDLCAKLISQTDQYDVIDLLDPLSCPSLTITVVPPSIRRSETRRQPNLSPPPAGARKDQETAQNGLYSE
jgi:hypothetical protein